MNAQFLGLVLFVLALRPDAFEHSMTVAPPAEEAPAPEGGATKSSVVRRFEGVWYRTPEKRGVLTAWLETGTLTVYTDTIIFESKKLNLTIPTTSIWRVVSTLLPNSRGVAWSVVQYDDRGLTKAAGFMDGNMFGNTGPAIFSELRLAAERGHAEPASVRFQNARGIDAGRTTNEGSVQMGHYSFKSPSGGGWFIQTPGDFYEESLITQQLAPTDRAGGGQAKIRIVRNQVTNQRLVKLSARENADKVRRDEWKTMRKEGVRQGAYELHDVSMREEAISGKLFFVMDYVTETPKDIERSSLFLLFPHERGNTSFLMVVYTEARSKPTEVVIQSRPDLVSVLSSLQFTSDE